MFKGNRYFFKCRLCTKYHPSLTSGTSTSFTIDTVILVLEVKEMTFLDDK